MDMNSKCHVQTTPKGPCSLRFSKFLKASCDLDWRLTYVKIHTCLPLGDLTVYTQRQKLSTIQTIFSVTILSVILSKKKQ